MGTRASVTQRGSATSGTRSIRLQFSRTRRSAASARSQSLPTAASPRRAACRAGCGASTIRAMANCFGGLRTTSSRCCTTKTRPTCSSGRYCSSLLHSSTCTSLGHASIASSSLRTAACRGHEARVSSCNWERTRQRMLSHLLSRRQRAAGHEPGGLDSRAVPSHSTLCVRDSVSMILRRRGHICTVGVRGSARLETGVAFTHSIHRSRSQFHVM